MRSRNTLVRGGIALIRKGSKTIVGVVELVDTKGRLSTSDLRANFERHLVAESDIDEEPVPYRHPAGAVIWVNLDPEVAAVVESRLAYFGTTAA